MSSNPAGLIEIKRIAREEETRRAGCECGLVGLVGCQTLDRTEVIFEDFAGASATSNTLRADDKWLDFADHRFDNDRPDGRIRS